VIDRFLLRRRTCALLTLALALLAGCAQLPRDGATSTPTTAATADGAFAPAIDVGNPVWRPVNIRFKTPTEYSNSEVGGVPCIRAMAKAAWSFLVADVPPPMARATRLSWRWNVPMLIADADNQSIGKDDSPARVVISFRGDRSKLDAADRATMSLAKALGGIDLPFAAIQYIWEGDASVGTLIPNANTGRIQKLVVRSGPEGLGSWLSFSRDVYADFRRAFPNEEPGDIESIGLMTDTDSLGGTAEACYADLMLR